MRGVFLDLETYKPEEQHIALLRPALEDWVFYDGTASEDVLTRIEGAEIIITNKVRITRDILVHAPSLKLIVIGATGTDNVDVQAAQEHGVLVCNVRGYSTPSVTQYIFAVMLSFMNSVSRYDALVKSGAWQANEKFCLLDYPMHELAGKTLGLIGYGEIARGVEAIARAFGMEVLIAERRGADSLRAGRAAFETVLGRSDIMSIHCPLNEETRGMIGVKEFAQMKAHAFLINAARGGIVDEGALAEALRRGYIAGAAVDVLSQEPPRDGNALLEDNVPNLIVTPHCAWASIEARLRMFEQIVEIIEAYKADAPMNVVG